MSASEIVPLEHVAPSGWCGSMHLVRLGDGVLLAPNHFHHLSLERFRTASAWRTRRPGGFGLAARAALAQVPSHTPQARAPR